MHAKMFERFVIAYKHALTLSFFLGSRCYFVTSVASPESSNVTK